MAKDQAQRSLESIQKGEAFDEVAKRDSDDPTQSSGGDLGFLSYSEMVPALQKEVQKMGPGKMSNIIEDNKSFMIVKVVEIKADGDPQFEKEKEMLRGKLLEGEFQHQIRLWLDRERALNFVSINLKS